MLTSIFLPLAGFSQIWAQDIYRHGRHEEAVPEGINSFIPPRTLWIWTKNFVTRSFILNISKCCWNCLFLGRLSEIYWTGDVWRVTSSSRDVEWHHQWCHTNWLPPMVQYIFSLGRNLWVVWREIRCRAMALLTGFHLFAIWTLLSINSFLNKIAKQTCHYRNLRIG